MPRDLPKNDLPVLVLAVLADAPRHGYAIAREIEARSGRSLRLREGSLYPALRVLEQDGLVTSEWAVQPSGPARRVYKLTEAGRGELSRRADAWKQYAETMERIIGGATIGEPA
jgi:PadR family transcriptional regulator PadR